MTTQVLTADEVRALVPMGEAIDAVRDAFVSLVEGEFEQPTRTALRDGGFLVMPVHHRPTATAMVKTLSVNFDRSPAITGTVMWSDAARADHVIADAVSVTALRTGAISGVATDLLAPAGASRLALIGAGAQAADQARAVHAVRPLTHLVIVDRDGNRAEELAEVLRAELVGVRVSVSSDAAQAVGGADIVSCATSSKTPLFPLAALPQRVHVNAIGAFRPTMRELPDALMGEATVVVDELDAVLEESGEVVHALDAGTIAKEDLIELGRALTDPPRPTERTVFKTVGVAVQDYAIARLLAAKALTARV
ncbi:ornithine cyclodeaminase family protein [Nocardiopsis sp. NRRL B-16309]|uniref:ornithine cyclodeaminase family protein n=1 Tax=Nocardiopsis sp. NRRL B-16309 TaxID=1519494 RepID=UPI0006AF67A9|nr:ornithine cyclodeaminase family protein [Nocardiopsis sp. NRRL B-16309]KOX10006.1 ornithine cyclodeaminase [Nocardiopsis sp. NRRL B-16309]